MSEQSSLEQAQKLSEKAKGLLQEEVYAEYERIAAEISAELDKEQPDSVKIRELRRRALGLGKPAR